MIFKNKCCSHRIALIALSLTLFGGGCLDQIDLPIPEGFQQSIFIDGKVVLGSPSIFTMQIGQLFTFTSDSRGSINARDALLMDSDGNQMVIGQSGTGRYYYEFQDDDPVKIEEGKSYMVRVGLFDGREFESTFEPLLPVPSIGDVSAQKVETTSILPDQTMRIDTFFQYTINTDLQTMGNSEKSFLRWESARVARITDAPISLGQEQQTCYVANRLGVLTNRIFGGPRQNIDQLISHLVYEERIDAFYGEGLYYTVVQESLSEAAYDYWDSVRQVSEEVGDIFGSPPGKIKSNFVNINDASDEAFGFFYATQHDTARLYIEPQSVDNRCPSPNQVNPDGSCRDALCCNCAAVASTVKPSFWTEE